MNTQFFPILKVTDYSAGSHCSVYPAGVSSEVLVHADTRGPVQVEMVVGALRDEVRRLWGSKHRPLHFSSEDKFLDWQCGLED